MKKSKNKLIANMLIWILLFMYPLQTYATEISVSENEVRSEVVENFTDETLSTKNEPVDYLQDDTNYNIYESDIEANTATFGDVNADSVFLKQAKGSTTCTLVASAMMMRRTAMMSGNSNWASITESSLKSSAWSSSGLYNSFSYAGISVKSAKISSNKTNTFISLLNQHPEGIVIYDFSYPHAILLTDYTDGVFYCADPAPGYASGRIPVSKASITVESADKYWYVASPSVSFTSAEKPSVGSIATTVNSGSVTFSAPINTGAGATTAWVYLWDENNTVLSKSVEIINGKAEGTMSFGKLAAGGLHKATLTLKIQVKDSAGYEASNQVNFNVGTEDISFNANEITLKVGESFKYEAYLSTTAQIVSAGWTSASQINGKDTVVVTKDGLATAYMPGTHNLTYSYNISTYDEDGNWQSTSLWQKDFKVHVIMDEPRILSIVADKPNETTINVQTLPGAEGYEVYRSSEADGEYLHLGTTMGGETSFTDTTGEDGHSYYYKVRGYCVVENDVIYSDYSIPTIGTYLNTATNITSGDNDKLNEITINWNKATSAAGYYIYRSTDTEDKELLADVKCTDEEADNVKYVDNTVEEGKTYYYTVCPYIIVGEETVLGTECVSTKVTAKIAEEYKLVFDYGDGTKVEKIIKENQTVNQAIGSDIINPTKNGYQFGGWYQDNALGTSCNFDDKVLGNQTYYAKWISLSSGSNGTTTSNSSTTPEASSTTMCTVTYKEDTGVHAKVLTTIQVPKGKTIASTGKKEPVTQKNGYIFKGWSYVNSKWNYSKDVVTYNITLSPIFEYEYKQGDIYGDDEYYEYKITGSTVTLTSSYMDEYDDNKYADFGAVDIPDTITINGKEYKVTAIADNAFAWRKDIETVKIGKNVKTIGKYAFAENINLYEVKMGKNVTVIGDHAFEKCSSLKSIKLPAKLKTIGNYAFKGCKKLKSITLGKKITKIGKSAFQECTSLKRIAIPASVQSIGKKAFFKCRKLGAITIKSKKLKTVGSSAFKSIKKGASVKVLKKYASDVKERCDSTTKVKGVNLF